MKRDLKNKIKNEYLGRAYATFCGMLIIILTISIIYFIASKGIKLFTQNNQSISEFLFSKVWDPEERKYGALIYILGSSAVSLGAVIISTPLAIALGIFINMISPKLGEKVMQPAMELFVGIPSVVYGWIGISVLVPIIKNYLGGLGFSLLAGILVLSVMILPTITSIASDAIKTVPKEYMESSYGLGATRWQTIKGIVVPSAKTGISTGVVLGLARAFGEALAVQMVIGNALRIPSKLLKPSSTLTGAITMDMGNTVMGTEWNNALWSMALLLLIISFIFIIIIRAISKRGEI